MDLKNTADKVTQSLKSWYRKLDNLSGGIVGIIRSMIRNFSDARGVETAASLAYYAFFSIFPMLLVVIVIGSFFIDRTVVQTQLTNMLQGVLPGVEEVIIENIERVLQLRAPVTFFALISLVWSATSVFNILAKNINRAFPKATIPNFFKGRLLGFFMLLILGFLMLLSFSISTFSSLIPVINIPFNDKALHESLIGQVGTLLLPIGSNTLMFWAMYRWVPTVDVDEKAAFLGGLIAGIFWELLNNGFTWYLSSGLSQYRLVYGSVGTVVALLFWIYLTSMITLMGAHLTASIQQAIQKKHAADEG